MGLDNDARGWIMAAVSGIACTFGASIICVDLIIRQLPGKRNFRIEDSNPFLSSGLSLSFGVMIFSSLYSMLPSARKYLQQGGMGPKEATFTLVGCFLLGAIGISILSQILHRYIPHSVVDCDHEHGDEEEGKADEEECETRGFGMEARSPYDHVAIRNSSEHWLHLVLDFFDGLVSCDNSISNAPFVRERRKDGSRISKQQAPLLHAPSRSLANPRPMHRKPRASPTLFPAGILNALAIWGRWWEGFLHRLLQGGRCRFRDANRGARGTEGMTGKTPATGDRIQHYRCISLRWGCEKKEVAGRGLVLHEHEVFGRLDDGEAPSMGRGGKRNAGRCGFGCELKSRPAERRIWCRNAVITWLGNNDVF